MIEFNEKLFVGPLTAKELTEVENKLFELGYRWSGCERIQWCKGIGVEINPDGQIYHDGIKWYSTRYRDKGKIIDYQKFMGMFEVPKVSNIKYTARKLLI